MPTATQPLVTESMYRQYHDQGFMILERCIPEETLAVLREECSYFLGYKDAQMDAAGKATQGVVHRGRRYFIANQYRLSPRLWQFLFSPLMAEIAQAVLGPNVYLFHEQWVVKSAEQGMKFGWHQDSGYVKFYDSQTRHQPYLSCWCPLDDVNEENGTVHLLPHSRAGTRDRILDHTREPGTNDLIGYADDDPGVAIAAAAGSIVAFTSYTLHRSGPNTTNSMRRVYLPQYSAEPILGSNGSLWKMAVPFVKDGKIIYCRDRDTADTFGIQRAGL